MYRCAVCLFALALTPLRPSSAQIIRGSVVDSATGLPVGAGFVVLLDETGKEAARTLTTTTGAFELRPLREGVFRIRSERIGYRPWVSAPIRLALRQVVEFDAMVTALPVQLATIVAREETTCRMRDEQSRAVALLWEEARKALAAASWNADQRQYRQTLLSYERDLDGRRRRVTNENTRFTRGLYEVPFRSLDPRILAERGYVSEDDRGDTWYYAPDANVLLDEQFHALHCFKVVEGEGDYEGLLGLGFEPIRSRRQPDVAGTLWIDPQSAELRQLDYTYTGLPNGVEDDRIGGSVEFLPMPSGAWIVHRWQIRTPKLHDDRGRAVVGGFRDTGGEILVVTTMAGDSVYAAPMAHVTGTVVDSSRGEFAVPLRGAIVQVIGTSFSAVSGGDGTFRLDAPLSGTYGVLLNHPRLDSLGVAATPIDVDLDPTAESSISLGVPTIGHVIEHHCDRQLPRGSRVLVGVVRDRYARPIADATVDANWQVVPILNDRHITVRNDSRQTRTDEDGRYALCDLPEGPIITVTGRTERSGENLEGGLEVTFEVGTTEVVVERGGAPTSRYYAPDPIWKVDLSLFAN